MNDISTDVAIIGAGPSGLSLGAHLGRLGVHYRILEAEQIGQTWLSVPPELSLVSPWWTNALSWRDVLRANPFAKVEARVFRDHLLRFAHRAAAHVSEHFRVAQVAPIDAGFCVRGDDGRVVRARRVVCASGYFHSPIDLVIADDDGSVPRVHAGTWHSYDDASRYAQAGASVVIVGKRVTAGQFMVELHRRGYDIALSVRAPVAFRRDGITAPLREFAYFFYEALRAWRAPEHKENSYPIMDGGESRQLIESGRVPLLGPIESIRDGAIHCRGGAAHRADLLLLATGYRPTLNFLGDQLPLDAERGLPTLRGFEAVELPGLYVLGFDNVRNFRSRYLRGLRQDARVLAIELYRTRSQALGADHRS
jgi:hypothetical protein